MTINADLLQIIDALEQAAMSCGSDAREECRARLHRMIGELERAGHPVPARLHEINAMLTDSTLEDAFDNMPV